MRGERRARGWSGGGRKLAALTSCGLAGLLLAVAAPGAPKKPPPWRSTSTVTTTTTVSTTTTVPTTTTVGTTTTVPVTTTTTTAAPPPLPPAPTADVGVRTLAPASASVFADATVTYTSVVTNAGPDTATGVFLAVAPYGARVVATATSAGSCSGSDTVQCAIGSLPRGASAVVSVTYAPAAGSTAILFDARAGSDEIDPDTSNNLARAETTVRPGHAGAPVLAAAGGGAFLPPLAARGAGATRTLTSSVHVDEAAVVYVRVFDGTGEAVSMLPGTLVDYRPAERVHTVIPQAIDGARWVPLRLRVPRTRTAEYRVVVRAVGPDGSAATTTLRFPEPRKP